jgi:hypothetical protein
MDCGIHNFFFDTDRKENTTVNIQKDKKKINDLQIPSFIQASEYEFFCHIFFTHSSHWKIAGKERTITSENRRLSGF